jgi:hypothetical protein
MAERMAHIKPDIAEVQHLRGIDALLAHSLAATATIKDHRNLTPMDHTDKVQQAPLPLSTASDRIRQTKLHLHAIPTFFQPILHLSAQV